MRVQSHNFNNEVNYPKDQDKNLINKVNSILYSYTHKYIRKFNKA